MYTYVKKKVLMISQTEPVLILWSIGLGLNYCCIRALVNGEWPTLALNISRVVGVQVENFSKSFQVAKIRVSSVLMCFMRNSRNVPPLWGLPPPVMTTQYMADVRILAAKHDRAECRRDPPPPNYSCLIFSVMLAHSFIQSFTLSKIVMSLKI